MEEIQVGEYIKLKDGLIGQFYNIEEGYDGNIIVNFEEFAYEYEDVKQFYEDILKHSKDITDLIQVGDIIEVHFPVRNKIRKIYVDEYFENSMVLNGITSKNLILKTILTKEMFEANCYKVKEK